MSTETENTPTPDEQAPDDRKYAAIRLTHDLKAAPRAAPPPASRPLPRFAGLLLFGSVILSAAVVLFPAWVMQPYKAQSNVELAMAYFLSRWGTSLALAAFALCALTAFRVWQSRPKAWVKVVSLLAACATLWAAQMSRSDRFGQYFAPLHSPQYVSARKAAFVAASDMVLTVKESGEARAYPVRLIAYHHLVQDTVGNTPLIVTYCSLCHTGVVWQATMDGRKLTFGIAGVRNQNTLLRDEETGTWWQQTTGKALLGPLKGRNLTPVRSEELTFETWKRENPDGSVLLPDPASSEAARYFPPNWEQLVGRLPTVTAPLTPGRDIPPRTLVVGVNVGGASRAYLLSDVQAQGIINDTVGDNFIAVVLGPDKKSVRVFARPAGTGAGKEPAPLSRKMSGDESSFRLVDAQPGSAWNFAGKSTDAALPALEPVPVITEYWFDWKTHHPATSVWEAAPAQNGG